MTTMPIALLAAATTASALGVLDYSAVPLLVSIGARIGPIDAPPSVQWIASLPAIVAAAALYGLSLVSARRKRPPRLKAVERIVGLPFAALSIAAVALASAANAGLEGHLLTGSERDAP